MENQPQVSEQEIEKSIDGAAEQLEGMKPSNQESGKHSSEQNLDDAYERLSAKGDDDLQRFEQQGGLNAEELQQVEALEQSINENQKQRELGLNRNQGQSQDQGMER